MSIVTFTDAAVDHIQTMMLKQTNSIGFRLSIKKTGCSGYAYVPQVIEKIQEHDIHFVAQNNLQVYIDPACEKWMTGVVVDYINDDAVGLKQKKLVFINPNEKNRCGCGESFTIE